MDQHTVTRPSATLLSGRPARAPADDLRLTTDQTFNEFYQARYSIIASALAVTVRDRQLGVEATDEAMTRAYERWDTIGRYDNPSGWVYRVGLNWSRSLTAKSRRLLPWSSLPADSMLPPGRDLALDEAMARLKPRFRAVVVCRYLLRWSTRDTAKALDIPEGTVKSRLAAALSQLRYELDVTEPLLPPTNVGPERNRTKESTNDRGEIQ